MGINVCAVDASQLRLPREPALQEKFGCQSAIPSEAKQTIALASVYYDVLNQIVLDAQLVETRESGRDCAAQHLACSKAKKIWCCMIGVTTHLKGLDLNDIHQVIVGGESGSPRARAMNPAWVDRIFEASRRSNTAFFFKQWGRWGVDGIARSKKANGRLYRGRTWDEAPGSSASMRNPAPCPAQKGMNFTQGQTDSTTSEEHGHESHH